MNNKDFSTAYNSLFISCKSLVASSRFFVIFSVAHVLVGLYLLFSVVRVFVGLYRHFSW